MENLDIRKLDIWSVGNVAQYLGVSRSRVQDLTEKYDLPYTVTMAGKVYFKSDIVAFQKGRKDKMKYTNNIYK